MVSVYSSALTRHPGALWHLSLLVRHLSRPELGRRGRVQRPRLLAGADYRRLCALSVLVVCLAAAYKSTYSSYGSSRGLMTGTCVQAWRVE